MRRLIKGIEDAYLTTDDAADTYLPLAGGTLTGDLTIEEPTNSNSSLVINGQGTGDSRIVFQDDGTTRWRFEHDVSDGNDFKLRRFNSSEVLQDSPIVADASNGELTLAGWKVSTEFTEFTPSWTNFSRGSATGGRSTYCYVPGGMWVTHEVVELGAGFSISGAIKLDLPNGETASQECTGAAVYRDGNLEYSGTVRVINGGSEVIFYGATSEVNATNPFTWASDDDWIFSIFVPL